MSVSVNGTYRRRLYPAPLSPVDLTNFGLLSAGPYKGFGGPECSLCSKRRAGSETCCSSSRLGRGARPQSGRSYRRFGLPRISVTACLSLCVLLPFFTSLQGRCICVCLDRSLLPPFLSSLLSFHSLSLSLYVTLSAGDRQRGYGYVRSLPVV